MCFIFRRKGSSYYTIFKCNNSILLDGDVTLTHIGFTPILPYPVTDFDAIFISMKNYQDVLTEKELPYGAFWCDEGVYHIAKELQLLKPAELSNLFIGLGGFHMEKVVLSCIGLYLKGIEVTDRGIMKGGNYVLSKKAMNNL